MEGLLRREAERDLGCGPGASKGQRKATLGAPPAPLLGVVLGWPVC